MKPTFDPAKLKIYINILQGNLLNDVSNRGAFKYSKSDDAFNPNTRDLNDRQ